MIGEGDRRYHLAWRRPVAAGGRDGPSLRCVRAFDRPEDASDLLAGVASRALDGEYRVDGLDGGTVFTTAPLIRAWAADRQALPRAATHSLWADEERRMVAHARFTFDLRTTVHRAVGAGLLNQRLASRLIRTAVLAIASEAASRAR